MADEPDWATLLKILHNNGGYGESSWEGSGNIPEDEDLSEYIDEEQDLREKLNLTWEEYTNARGVLLRADLIKRDVISVDEIGHIGDDLTLTHEGFNVAHERELAKRQDRTNGILALLTGGLFYAAIMQAQVAWYQSGFSPGRKLYLFFQGLVLLGLIYYGLRRFDVI